MKPFRTAGSSGGTVDSLAMGAEDNPALRHRLERIVSRRDAELANCAVGVVRDAKVAFTFVYGSCAPGTARAADRPYRLDSLIRVASLSKPFVAIAVLTLCESGLVGLDTDASDILGFRLRNPSHPDVAITPRMLLCHTSSLRDGDRYSLPPDRPLRGFFDPRSADWDHGVHFASPCTGSGRGWCSRPGEYFRYCNLGYGVLGTLIERTTGVRFDQYVGDAVLRPIGLEGGFGPASLSSEALARLVPPYRKIRAGRYATDGQWVAQTDHSAFDHSVLHEYVVGTNATFLSPQGGLRASCVDLLAFVRFMVDPSLRARAAIVSEARLAEMMHPNWMYDKKLDNGTPCDGVTRLAGLGLFRTTATADSEGSDRLLPGGGPLLWGHHGDAYGFRGGVLFDPDGGYGFCYTIGGTAADPHHLRGNFSSYSYWEEAIHEAVLTAYPP